VNAARSVLIVDDEPLARAGMAALVAREPGFAVVGECPDGRSALAALKRLRPDVVLLDVRMPDLDGFEVLELAAPPPSTQVIFVTAFDEHAVRAFEFAAADYVLKPFDDRRFRAALERVRSRESREAPPPTLVAGPPSARVLLRASDIDWIEAADYCVRVHAGGRSHLLRASLDELTLRLDGSSFVRIHRRALIRLDRLAEVRRDPGGRGEVVLRDGTVLPLSRAGRVVLSEALRTLQSKARGPTPPIG